MSVKFTNRISYRRNDYCSKLSDSEIITLNIVREIHRELMRRLDLTILVRILKKYYRICFNRMCRNLTKVIGAVLANSFDRLKARIQIKVLGRNSSYFMSKCLDNKVTGRI